MDCYNDVHTWEFAAWVSKHEMSLHWYDCDAYLLRRPMEKFNVDCAVDMKTWITCILCIHEGVGIFKSRYTLINERNKLLSNKIENPNGTHTHNESYLAKEEENENLPWDIVQENI